MQGYLTASCNPEANADGTITWVYNSFLGGYAPSTWSLDRESLVFVAKAIQEVEDSNLVEFVTRAMHEIAAKAQQEDH